MTHNCITQSHYGISEMQPSNHPSEPLLEITTRYIFASNGNSEKNLSSRWDLKPSQNVLQYIVLGNITGVVDRKRFLWESKLV